MKILESYLDVAKSLLTEADDDKYASIGFGRFKLKGKEDDDDADVFVKTDGGKYVKSADQKSDDDGEKDAGGKLGKGDFDRDMGDLTIVKMDKLVDGRANPDLYDEFITLPIPNNMLDLPTTGYFKGGLVRSGFKW